MKTRRFRPQIEILEQRCVPAALFWNGAVNDDWDTGSGIVLEIALLFVK